MARTDLHRRILRGAILGIALVVAGAASARAAGPDGRLSQSVSTGATPAPAKPGEPRKDWRQETEATCGMVCRYHRANDNLTMQALYLVTKIGKIEAELQRNDPKEDVVRTALGAFCKSRSEDVKDCFARYKDFQRVALLELRQSIGKNEDTIARLTQGRKADGTVEGTALAFETGEKALPYMPEVPTLSELEQTYLEGKLKTHGAKFTRAEIQKWSMDLVRNDPRARNIEFQAKPAVGNPYQSDGASYSLYMQKGKGGEDGPEDAKVKAMKQPSLKRIEEFAADKGKEIADGEAKVIAPTKKLKDDDQLSYEAFVQARSVVNSKIEKDVSKADEEEKQRKLASDPKPTPSPGPSSTPIASANPNAGVARDVKVTAGGSARRAPSGMKIYQPDEKVARPPEMKNSRYIKYDLGDLLRDIEDSTK